MRNSAAPQKSNGKVEGGDNVARTLQPLGDRVVIKAIEQESQTKSGLYVPDSAKERPQEGNVIAVGPGRVTDEGKRVEMDIKAGDIVVYSKFAGVEFKEDGEELLILTERDILAKVS
jgi:chaperonin GroES